MSRNRKPVPLILSINSIEHSFDDAQRFQSTRITACQTTCFKQLHDLLTSVLAGPLRVWLGRCHSKTPLLGHFTDASASIVHKSITSYHAIAVFRYGAQDIPSAVRRIVPTTRRVRGCQGYCQVSAEGANRARRHPLIPVPKQLPTSAPSTNSRGSITSGVSLKPISRRQLLLSVQRRLPHDRQGSRPRPAVSVGCILRGSEEIYSGSDTLQCHHLVPNVHFNPRFPSPCGRGSRPTHRQVDRSALTGRYGSTLPSC